MKLYALLALCVAFFIMTEPSYGDWRWAPPHLRKQTVTYHCADLKCIRQTYVREKHRYLKRVKRYDKRRLHEWNHWAHLYIPACTWYGESGTGPQFAPYRYVLPNSHGSGALGKYQMMPGTYGTFAKYFDWSALDQEIAGHKLYWDQGTGPWTNCH
jgi:hypothetical protein